MSTPWKCRRCDKPVPPRRGRIPNIILCESCGGPKPTKKAHAKKAAKPRHVPSLLERLEAKRDELTAAIAELRRMEKLAS